ncbi:transcriptional regulator UhpA [Photobacterium damselae subsp. piscicida]|nr:transcriptional regulator UhpA [Photobacterium damselae subsp. piscicida]MDP2569400.1 transcriptional regulator UhpA [Photobacterium damselae subsp. piscicida]
MIKVVLIDDHMIVRSGFSQLLSLEDDIEVVGEFGSAAEARVGLPGTEANVCILDISMPDESGLSLLKDIPSGIACIMLSVHDSVAVINQALSCGAVGYLSKRCSPDELIDAVRSVATGKQYFSPDIEINLVQQEDNEQASVHLTKREREIGLLLAKGLDVKTVAAELGLSHKTVHVHRANAMEKLGLKNNVELSQYFHGDLV